ncbi:hypothetical protein N3K66_004164 [Trichothecium roseum]|uniref:Uncharacterized protein n=1 Tax=Trichothecium roseum TaxID=47278 RepID=A0ACC0V0K6_9HYPO|nr:hypothetical protein N3K66_004164 [Trichothecium roseum]
MGIHLLDLPNEVLSLVCAEFAPPDYSVRFKPGATLWSISLTCSALRDVAVPFMFGPVACQRREEPCLLRLLVQRPYIARSIRRMWFDASGGSGGRGAGNCRPRILSGRASDARFADEHIQNDASWSSSLPGSGTTSITSDAVAEPGDAAAIKQMSSAEYTAYALTKLPRLEKLYLNSPLLAGDALLHHPGRQDLFSFPSLLSIGDRDCPAADMLSLSHIIRRAPRLREVTACLPPPPPRPADGETAGSVVVATSASVTHLDLRNACCSQNDDDDGGQLLARILAGLPSLSSLTFQQCACPRAHVAPRDLCAAIAAKADTLQELSLDLEANVVDSSSTSSTSSSTSTGSSPSPPEDALTLSFTRMRALRRLRIRASNALYGHEKHHHHQPASADRGIDFSVLLPPQIEDLTVDFSRAEALPRDDFLRLARAAPLSFPSLRRLAAGGAFANDDDADVVAAFAAAGIKVY